MLTLLFSVRDCFRTRAVQPPELDPVIWLADGGGLHHRYAVAA
jgi:hypothetical protein